MVGKVGCESVGVIADGVHTSVVAADDAERDGAQDIVAAAVALDGDADNRHRPLAVTLETRPLVKVGQIL